MKFQGKQRNACNSLINCDTKSSMVCYVFFFFSFCRFKQNSERAYQIKEWHQDGGVMIMGYDMFRNLSSDNKRIKKKLRDTLQRGLVEPGPDLVVCDEGHLLKNSKTSLSKAVNRIRTLRRIVLTGTPLQNNLNECK